MQYDLGRLNSATKYPSILTYHSLNPKNGCLIEERMGFTGDVTMTEKVDGTNGRIIFVPNPVGEPDEFDWFIGSREEILYAKGDRIMNPHLNIVETLRPVAEMIQYKNFHGVEEPLVMVLFFEVYGSGVGSEYKNYTTKKQGLTDALLFDIAQVPVSVLDMERDRIASWREHGGQEWFKERELQDAALYLMLETVPRLGTWKAIDLPTDILGTLHWLEGQISKSNVVLDESGRGKPEGLVIRSKDRASIAKIRFQDYQRTLRKMGASL